MLTGGDELLLRNKRFLEGGEKLTRKCFRSRGRVGASSSSEVHAVVSLLTGRNYAISVLPAGVAAQINLNEQLRAAARCNNENVLHLHAAWEEDGSVLLITELAETTLLERLRRQRVMSESETGAVASDLCKALVYLHGLSPPLSRRELRPYNAMLVCGRWKLRLFGRKRGEETVSDSLSGEKADVWSIGALMYEMMHGKLPFSARSQPLRLEIDRHLTEEAAEALTRLLSPGQQPSPREVLDLAFFRRQRGVPYALNSSQRTLVAPEDEGSGLLAELLSRCEQGEKRHTELLKELNGSDTFATEKARQAILEEQLIEAKRQLAASESQSRELDTALGQSGSGMAALQTELHRKHEHNQALYIFTKELGETISGLAGRPALPALDPASLKALLGGLLADLARGTAQTSAR